ncbi:MAG TPA: DUF3305 domain-containing protein [Burkholderiales bacterium]|nr:DUF3305 domain-containing protein [Burkholderiales bacterium]
MEKPRRTLAVIMQRRALANRWQSEAWEPWGVLADDSAPGEPRLLVDERGVQQWLHPGFELVLHRDELDGYYLNVSSERPKVFVLWLAEEGRARPLQLTASYHEASRWMDAGHTMDGVPMPPEIFAWVGDCVERNYRPEPEKRIKPRSFVHPKDRVGG